VAIPIRKRRLPSRRARGGSDARSRQRTLTLQAVAIPMRKRRLASRCARGGNDTRSRQRTLTPGGGDPDAQAPAGKPVCAGRQ